MQNISEEFKKIIDEDIVKCEEAIRAGNKTDNLMLHSLLAAKYAKIIDGFDEGLRTLFYDEDGKIAKANIDTMKQKLILFRAMNYENRYSLDNTGIAINNNNQIQVDIDISFDAVRKN